MFSYFSKQETEGRVWFDRLTTKGPSPLKTAISNKVTIRLKDQLAKYGINIVKRIALEIKPNKIDLNYLKVKKRKMNHKLKLV